MKWPLLAAALSTLLTAAFWTAVIHRQGSSLPSHSPLAAGQPRKSERPSPPPQPDPRIASWVRASLSIGEARDAAVAEMLASLHDPADRTTALDAFIQACRQQAKFDRAPFRPVLIDLLENPDPHLRALALQALYGLPADPADLPRFLKLADDAASEVREAVVLPLTRLAKRDLTGVHGDAILKILEATDKPSPNITVPLHYSEFSPALERRIAFLARDTIHSNDPDLTPHSLRRALTTQRIKGEICVDFLLEALDSRSIYDVVSDAAKTLAASAQRRTEQGLVAPGLGLEKKIADRALRAICDDRKSEWFLRSMRECLDGFGTLEHAEGLEEIAAYPAIGPREKAEVLEIASRIRDRLAGHSLPPLPTEP